MVSLASSIRTSDKGATTEQDSKRAATEANALVGVTPNLSFGGFRRVAQAIVPNACGDYTA
jgi:hypothetical protein